MKQLNITYSCAMKIFKLATVFSGILLCSCSRYYYVANIQNVPLFREKNEVHLSGGYAIGDESQSIEVQSAYSLSKQVGIMANYMHSWGGIISDKDYGKGYYIDGAIGYFKPVGKYGVFEIYGGFGGSGQHHEYTDTYSGTYQGSADLSFVKFFLQPSFGFTFNWLDAAVSLRICNISYTDIKNFAAGSNDYAEINALQDKGHPFAEPAFTLRAGWKNMKFQFQASYAANLNNPTLYFGEEAHISFGLYCTIANRFKKIK